MKHHSSSDTCVRCLYNEAHPLGLTLDEEGICSGCKIHEEKDSLDWEDRWDKLEKIVKPYRSGGSFTYDCIVPVTGGNDSYFIVHIVKNKLGLNPLLVTYNKYFNTPLGIENLANLRIKFNCDILIQNVNPVSVRRITRTTLRKFGSIYWHCLAGQTVFPVQTAVFQKIPLIIWGGHQGVEQVGMFSHTHEVEMTRRYRKDHDLMGFEADDLLSMFDTLKEEDIWQYRYPDDNTLNSVGVRGIYLGNYLRWDPKAQHDQMVQYYGYKSATFDRTFDTYDHVDCFNFMDLHDVLKLYKHGYSKVTDHACREIRHGRLDKNQALHLVRRLEQRPMKFSSLFGEWLGITEKSLAFLMDQHRNNKYWEETSPGNWIFKKDIDWGCESLNSKKHSKKYPFFISNSELDGRTNPKYVIVGKGYPEYRGTTT